MGLERENVLAEQFITWRPNQRDILAPTHQTTLVASLKTVALLQPQVEKSL